MKRSLGNSIKLLIFILGIGAVCSLVLWLFLFAVNKGTYFLWELLPSKTGSFSGYPIVLCTAGGLLIGLFRKKFGDYPQSMMEVFRTLKTTKTYSYRNLPVILVAALLPLIFGSSVGPEAAVTASAALGFTMKKPAAVTMLLFLCFSVRMVIWILLAAVAASFIAGWRPGRR